MPGFNETARVNVRKGGAWPNTLEMWMCFNETARVNVRKGRAPLCPRARPPRFNETARVNVRKAVDGTQWRATLNLLQ